MEFRKFGTKYIVRIDKGEEIVASLADLCKKENILLGDVRAIGAVDRLTIGLFDTTTKEYYKTTLEGAFEISSLIGNISTMKGENYLHLHITVTDADYMAKGGHLNEAWVSGTCEMVIDVIDGEMDRAFSDEIGLNLYKF